MAASNCNLGCGPVFVDNPDWINLDFTTSSPAVQQANLLDRLPLESDAVQVVYASHFLEHIPKPDVHAFLRECLRVLKPGGVLRLVLPDLEEMARSYLALRDSGEHERADFVVLEMIDQCVRRESGGELGRLYGRLRDAGGRNSEMIDFVRERTGEDLAGNHYGTGSPGGGGPSWRKDSFAELVIGYGGSGCGSGWLGCPRRSAHRTSASRASASATIGSGTFISCNKRSRRRASLPWNADRPQAAPSRISPSIRSTSMPKADRARGPSRCTSKRGSPAKFFQHGRFLAGHRHD